MMPQSVLDRYDLIGFDPRGVGHSTPVSCGLTAEQQDVTLVNPMPSPDGSIDANTAYAQAVANECANGPSAGEFPFMTTANTARDMG
jgi:hypothetical protein